MSKRGLISQELERASEAELDALLDFIRALKARHNNVTLLAESALAKDWLRPEEDTAWADL